MNSTFRCMPFTAALMGAVALAALPVHAQDETQTGEEGAIELSPLIVEGTTERADGPVEGPFATQSATATKTDTPIIETPQSISVISSEEMETRGARSVAEAVRYSTGITTENRGGVVTRYDMLNIRGFDVTRNYLDGMQLHYNGWYAVPQIAPEMVERLEILKGPASVLYGNSPPGGLINLVSKRPQNTPSGEVSVGVGTNNLYEGMIDATGPIDPEGKFSYRFIGLGRTADGQARTTELERRLIAPSLKWAPTDNTSITFLAHYQHDPKSGAFGAAPGAGSAFPNSNGQVPTDFYDGDVKFEEFNRKQLALGYIIEHEFDETFTFKQSTRFFRTDVDYKSIYGAALNPFDNRTLFRGAIYSDEKSISYAVDNQLKAKFETGLVEHTFLAGLDYWHLDSDVEIGRLTPTLLNPFVVPPVDIYNPDNDQILPAVPVTEIYDYERDQTGIYLQEQFKLGGLVVLLGGRQDWYESNDYERLGATASSLSQDQFSGRAGILYRFDSGIAPYISYAESFEPQSGADRLGNVFVPTTGQQIEGGIKFQSPNDTVMITAALFDLTKQNVTVQDPAGVPGDQIQQGEIRSRGFEIEGHVRPLAGLTLSAFYTKLDIETTKDTNAANIGNTPVMVADETASFWAEYALPTNMIDGLTVGGGARYVGETYVDAANTAGTTDPYTLFDAMVEYDLAAISPELAGNSVRLNGTNLADKRHVTGCFTQLNPTCWFGQERQVTLTLTHRW
ncbi:TonB-dependent siderophore receptor [Parvibaculum sp.]|uniref:TonB-dependent siderophore receptor n=1 Tax=Parvibaculum sp. TaxID=2024848 RepID=UPI003BAC28B8